MKLNSLVVAITTLSALSSLPLASHADSWLPARVTVITSTDQNTLLRITPGIPRSAIPATASILKYDAASGEYRKAAEFLLRNPVSPANAVISNHGEFIVTFDDWASVGRTTNTVVVYRSTGEVAKAWSLSEIFSRAEIGEFLQSVSSTMWRGPVHLSEDGQNGPVVVIPPETAISGTYTQKFRSKIFLDLATMTFRSRAGEPR